MTCDCGAAQCSATLRDRRCINVEGHRGDHFGGGWRWPQ